MVKAPPASLTITCLGSFLTFIHFKFSFGAYQFRLLCPYLRCFPQVFAISPCFQHRLICLSAKSRKRLNVHAPPSSVRKIKRKAMGQKRKVVSLLCFRQEFPLDSGKKKEKNCSIVSLRSLLYLFLVDVSIACF